MGESSKIEGRNNDSVNSYTINQQSSMFQNISVLYYSYTTSNMFREKSNTDYVFCIQSLSENNHVVVETAYYKQY